MGKFEQQAAAKGLVARDIKNAIIANLWIFAWAASLGVVSYLSDLGWYSSPSVIIVGLVIHIGIGVGMVLAYKRFLTEADELERKIQLDALAISVGAILVTFSSYSILEKSTEIPPLSPAYLIMVMAAAYCVGLIIGRRRFR